MSPLAGRLSKVQHSVAILLRLTDSIAAFEISLKTPGIISEESTGPNTSLSGDDVTGKF